MDGRTQLPVINYLRKRFKAVYVDSITEPGPNLILAENTDELAEESIFKRLEISIESHKSAGVAVAGHFDCAGNPAGREKQNEHTLAAVRKIKARYPGLEIIALWVDEKGEVIEIE
jgi:hypothetical protein